MSDHIARTQKIVNRRHTDTTKICYGSPTAHQNGKDRASRRTRRIVKAFLRNQNFE